MVLVPRMKKNNMKYRLSDYVRGKTVTRELDLQALYKHCVRKAWQPISGQKYQANIVDVELNLAESKDPEEWVKVRLLFVRGNAGDTQTTAGKHDWAVFLTSDTNLSSAAILELYALRWAIEILFPVLKHVIGAFNFRFWTKSLPKHSRRPFPNRDLTAPQPHQIGTILACWQAYETFVLCASIATGLLQFIAINFQDTVWAEHRLHFRTQSRDLPSEKTVKQIIAQLFVMQFFRLGQNGIIQEIRFYMMTISDEIDDD